MSQNAAANAIYCDRAHRLGRPVSGDAKVPASGRSGEAGSAMSHCLRLGAPLGGAKNQLLRTHVVAPHGATWHTASAGCILPPPPQAASTCTADAVDLRRCPTLRRRWKSRKFRMNREYCYMIRRYSVRRSGRPRRELLASEPARRAATTPGRKMPEQRCQPALLTAPRACRETCSLLQYYG